MASYRDFLPVVSDGEWVRPSDWLALPTVTEAEQKFVGLHAVFPEGNNFCAFLLTTSAGQYRVDWGDGTVTLHNSNTKAEYQYDYSTISASTDTTRGYRQAIVTVTPVSGNITAINFQQIYTGQNQAYATGWLDVTGSFPSAVAGAGVSFGGTTVRHTYVEQVNWVTIGSATNLVNHFYNCYSLQSVPLFNTASVTNMDSTFRTCISIRSIPLFNTSSVTDMASMFFQCYSLQTVPLLVTSLVQNMNNMFNACHALKLVPLLNTSSCVAMSSMFFQCYTLESVPLFVTTSVTNMSNMFGTCISLQSVPALSTVGITTSVGTDFGSGFAATCNSLDRCQMVFARTVGFANCQLGVTALVEIFTNLVDRSATTSATITITSNWGAALLSVAQRNIAISKNWLITG
jgi:surface protein